MKRTAMDTLYKYLKPDLIGACLPAAGDGSLRATQPAALNDPFECFMAPGNAEVFGAGNQVIADMLSGLNGTTPVKPDSVEKARCKSGSLFLRDLLVEQLSQRYGIVSFASDPLHPVMWAHYGNYGTGFVIGYDRAIITSLCDRTDPLREIHYDSRVLPLVTLDVLNEKNVDNLLSKEERRVGIRERVASRCRTENIPSERATLTNWGIQSTCSECPTKPWRRCTTPKELPQRRS